MSYLSIKKMLSLHHTLSITMQNRNITYKLFIFLRQPLHINCQILNPLILLINDPFKPEAQIRAIHKTLNQQILFLQQHFQITQFFPINPKLFLIILQLNLKLLYFKRLLINFLLNEAASWSIHTSFFIFIN